MKYDIMSKLSQVHWFENNICQKKIALFSPKIGRKNICQNPFQTIIRLKKRKKKKGAWITKPLV